MTDYVDNVIKDYISRHQYKAILHIGGEYGKEAHIYQKCAQRFTYIEPHPVYAQYLADLGYDVLEIAIGTGDGTFYCSKNASSLLKPLEHKIENIIKVEVVPLSAVEEGYDCIVIDAQGSSYDILKSGTLKDAKTIVCEASENARYDGEKTLASILELLLPTNFVLVAIYPHGPYDIYDLVFEKHNNMEEY